MFYCGFLALHCTMELVALDFDDLWNAQLDCLLDFEHE
jgi:hypothetical protein